jgi:hypothetical protein
MRPVPYRHVAKVPTLWLNITTGLGVDDDGNPVKPLIGGRRSKPHLVDLLATAHRHRAKRIVLSGPLPTRQPGTPHWLLAETPGWRAGGPTGMGLWLEDPPTGRFTHVPDGAYVEVRVVSEWFDDQAVEPSVAREAWAILDDTCRRWMKEPDQDRKLTLLMKSPAATGQQLWAHMLPGKKKNSDEWLWDEAQPSDDDAALIHATAGQHRIEHFVAGPERCGCGDCPALVTASHIDALSVIDGRFAYAPLIVGELPSGPATWLTAAQGQALFDSDQMLNVKARYHIRFTVPDVWDTLGMFPVQLPAADGDRGKWHYPCRPGATHETWIDGAEARWAHWMGWRVEVLEAMTFKTARPLDNFARNMRKVWDAIEDLDATPLLRQLVRKALRQVVLQAIGSLNSRGKDSTYLVDSLDQVPPEYIPDVVDHGGRFVYRRKGRLEGQASAYHHPEIAAHLWSKSRARMFLRRVTKQEGPLPRERRDVLRTRRVRARQGLPAADPRRRHLHHSAPPVCPADRTRRPRRRHTGQTAIQGPADRDDVRPSNRCGIERAGQEGRGNRPGCGIRRGRARARGTVMTPDLPSSREAINQLISDGVSIAAIARAVRRDPKLIRMIGRGQKPGENLQRAVNELMRTGRVTHPPERRTARSGLPAKVRGKRGEPAVIPPDAPRPSPRTTGGGRGGGYRLPAPGTPLTGDDLPVTDGTPQPRKTRVRPPTKVKPGGSKFREATHPHATGNLYSIAVPKTEGPGRESGRQFLMDKLDEAQAADQRVRFQLSYADGRIVPIGSKRGYNSSDALNRSIAEGDDPLAWLEAEADGIALYDLEGATIVGVQMVTFT